MIKDNLARINEKINTVCSRINRAPNEIVVVGVSKYTDIHRVNEAIAAGLKHVGENRVQDAKEKFAGLNADYAVVRHMVGHLQTNKAKTAVEIFDLIQSVDSVKLAQEIQKHAVRLNKKMTVLAQINISAEEQKSGMLPEEIDSFLDAVQAFDHISVQGLMTIGPLTEDQNIVRDCFKRMKKIFDQVKTKYRSDHRIDMKYLSMGMSGDFELAIAEGANMVRIGRAIFHGE